MNANNLTIASRKSPLAIAQSDYVKQHLLNHHPELTIEIKGMLTQGDKLLATPLNKIGGKGLFVKELEKAILERRADIAVHSIKDMLMELPDGLGLATICKREDPRDVMVSNKFESIDDLPQGAIVGTSSLRRQCQLLNLRPDLQIVPARGNVHTRLRKLDEGEFDAMILAAAGLIRVDFHHRIKQYIDTEIMLPAAGQGAIGIECRVDDLPLLKTLAPLNDHNTQLCVTAERAITNRLGGSCQVPIGAYARLMNEQIVIQALVGRPDGSEILRASKAVAPEDAAAGGIAVAEELINQGADNIIADCA